MNIKHTYYREIETANYALKPLTVEDIVNYKKSEGLGRIWQKIKLIFSGKGIVNTETIKKMLSPKNIIELKATLRDEIIDNKLNIFCIVIEDELKRRVRLGNTVTAAKSKVDEEKIVKLISKTIASWVKEFIIKNDQFNVKECVIALDSFNFRDILRKENLTIEPYFWEQIIEEGINSVQEDDFSQIDDENKMESIRKLAKQISNFSEAILFLP